MAEIDVVNQRIEDYTDVVEAMRTKIEQIADNKTIDITGGTDTPLSVLTKIDNGTIKAPTDTINITSNGTVDVTNYANANVAVEQALKDFAEGTMTTFKASDYGITTMKCCSYGVANMDLTGVTEIYSISSNRGIGATSITKLAIGASTLKIYPYALREMNYVADFTFDPNTNVTSLGTYSFAQFGANRSSPSSRPIVMDFRNSTFTDIPTYCFSNANTASSTGSPLTYTTLYFPSVVSSIGNYAFQGMSYSNLFFKSVPTVTSYSFGGNTCKYFFLYNSVRTARATSNWSSKLTTSNSYGWAEENTFETGDTLPATDSSGNILTWYSDISMSSTYEIETVPDGSKIYYCKVT